MSSIQALRNAEIDRALSELKDEIRKSPADAKHRVFLFQLFAVVGDWDRALTQLNVVKDLDASALPMVQAYQETLNCEALRSRVFAGERSPLLFGEPQPWMALMMEALRHTAAGRVAEAAAMRDEAFEAAPATSGALRLRPADAEPAEERPMQPFAWIADADPRLGPMLEAIVNGRYFWIPFQHIAAIDIERPQDLRDVVWMPAHFVWSNGGDAVGFIPTRYPGSESHDDDLIRLARKTEWRQAAEEFHVGLGQRLLATDAEEYPLMQIERIELNRAGAEA